MQQVKVHLRGPLGSLHCGNCARAIFRRAKQKSYRKVGIPSNGRKAKHTDTQWATSTASMSPIVWFEKKIDHTLRCGALPFENRPYAILATTKPAAHLVTNGLMFLPANVRWAIRRAYYRLWNRSPSL